ncbi:MAG: hypothetical protein A2V85_17530 [Chloroflexi bacterium RBG_16_72_14]|nr:MAG: hypothetical protein A2V85_17530 [Chloroflexi bacterium RBG_16_72_14]
MTVPAAARVVDAVGAGLGPAVLAGTAIRRPVPIPGVGEGIAWLVRDDDADHPMQCYVGVWPDGAVRLLSDDQPAFFDLVAATGADIVDPSTALGYVRAFLEVTRGPAVIVREVRDVADLRWRPGSQSEEANRARFEAGPPIEPPVVEPSAGGFHVELTLVVDQRVQRNVFDVGRDGSIRTGYRVLADDLPLPIAR